MEPGAGLASTGLNPAAMFKGMDGTRLVGVEETLANLSSGSESLRGIAHDARNMVTALGLYCELLEEPGVLSPDFAHYGKELRLVVTASRRLVEKLAALDTRRSAETPLSNHIQPSRAAGKNTARAGQEKAGRWELVPAQPINSLASDLLANRNLLAALAGPSISVTIDVKGGALPVRLTIEDLTRVLVNLVKNASEAMTAGGRVHVSLNETGLSESNSSDNRILTLVVEDDGPGIPAGVLEKIFDSGYTTRDAQASRESAWPATHRGLGLSITRSILETAGGRIQAANRSQGGARFEIELPVRAC
jgi:signal transduction histidine kinase